MEAGGEAVGKRTDIGDSANESLETSPCMPPTTRIHFPPLVFSLLGVQTSITNNSGKGGVMSNLESYNWESELSDGDAAVLRGFLQESGALLQGHFVLTSGLHSPFYLQCARLLMDPVRAEWCGKRLAKLVVHLKPAWVLSPALGGLIIGHELARGLGVPHLFAERKDGAMSIRRGFTVPEGQPFLAVEDVVTTGGSVLEAAKVAQEMGGQLVGIAAILNRSGNDQPFREEAPFHSLLKVLFPTYPADQVPPELEALPVYSPGSRRN